MSAFYDLASLVLVPSGYKASKVYAQKPLTTDGQLTFSRASTATRVNSAGLIEEVASNVPRLDYTDSTCPKLLLEPQRTNSVLFSEQFNNAAYSSLTAGSATAAIVTANFATSPDGHQNADRLQFSRTGTTSSDLSLLLQNAIVLSATGTATIYLKSNTSSTQNVLLYWGGGQGIVFAVTPEWQRFTLPNLAAGTDTILIGTRGGSGSFFNGGDLTLDVLAYGFQIEAGAYPTSYIPTTSAAVTRLADACSKTGISSLIGQTEGTIFIDGEVVSGQPTMFFWVRNSASGLYDNFITCYTDSNRNLIIEGYTNGANIVYVVGPMLAVGRHKVAFNYAANNFVLYADGQLIGTDNSGAISTYDSLYIDQYIDGGIRNASKKQALLFKTRLTNAQLAELTAL